MNGTVTPVSQPNVTVKPTLKVNGAAPAAEPKAAPAAAPTVDYAAEQAKLKAGLDELARQSKRHAAERQKLSEERRAHEKAIAEAKKYAAEREQLRLNPEAVLKAELGDDYYDKITNMRLSGGAPPAALVQAEIQKLRDDFEAKLAERDTAAKTAQQTQAEQRQEQARNLLRSEASDYAKGEGKDSALLVAYSGDPELFGKAIAQRVEAEYSKNPSKVLSTKEAVDLVENELFQLVEKVTASEKWKSRSKPNPNGAPAIQQRRTLSNSTTGRTPGREPPRSEEERRERALQAYNELRARNAG